MQKNDNYQSFLNIIKNNEQEFRLNVLNNQFNTYFHAKYQKIYLDALHASKRKHKMEYDELLRNSYEKIRVFDKVTAENFLSELDKPESDNEDDEKIVLRSPELLKRILHKVFNPETDHKIFNYFSTEYVPISAYAFKVKAKNPHNDPVNSKKNYSLRWHCDAGPEKQLKLLIHLCDMQNHDGGTYILDRETTEKLRDIGYIHNKHDDRKADIEALCKYYNIEYQPKLIQTDIGEALIFNPSRLLHCGLRDSLVNRIYISVLLIPFVTDWEKFLDQNIDFVINNINSSFPRLG